MQKVGIRGSKLRGAMIFCILYLVEADEVGNLSVLTAGDLGSSSNIGGNEGLGAVGTTENSAHGVHRTVYDCKVGEAGRQKKLRVSKGRCRCDVS